MSQFIAAVHAPKGSPRAVALVETGGSASAVSYTVRDVRALGDDPFADINALLASEAQYVGRTFVVTTGGQAGADALRAHGPSAAAVTLMTDGTSADRDALDVSVQVLVDTFQMHFRAGSVTAPSPSEAASGAISALYRGADLDNAALDGDRDDDGDLDDPDGISPEVIEQSGSSEGLSTERVKRPIGMRGATAAAVAQATRVGRIAAHTGEGAPDLGEHADAATALALAVWYGEASADDLPLTDQADAINDRRARRNAARASGS
ncbi:MAG: hypothetical protein AAFQ43_09990 [Bacteroidota bacterium]